MYQIALFAFYLATAAAALGVPANRDECNARFSALKYREKFLGQERDAGPFYYSGVPDWYAANWEKFDEAVKRFSSSKRSPEDIAKFVHEMNLWGKTEFDLWVKLRDSTGDLVPTRIKGPLRAVYKEPEERLIGSRPEFTSISFFTETNKQVTLPFKEFDFSGFHIDKIPPTEAILAEKSRLSEIARRSGFHSVNHNFFQWGRSDDDPVKILLNIFKDKQLGRLSGNSGKDSNFFTLGRANSTDPKFAVIEFDLRLLDRKDFYINPSIQYGRFTPASIRFDEPRRLRHLFYNAARSPSAGGIGGGELVVWAPAPTSHIRRIHLTAELIERFKREAAEQGIAPPKGRSWDDIFVTVSP